MKRDKKAFFNEKCKEIEEGKTAWKRLDISSRKLEVNKYEHDQRTEMVKT